MGSKLALSIISFKDLRTAFIIILMAILVPILAVILLTQVGISLVSNALAKFDPQSAAVKLFNPNGTPFKDWTGQVTWPVKGAVTLEFGQFDPPFQLFHTGIDIANPQGKEGDQIVAFADGTVIYAAETQIGCGKHVILDNGDDITSYYCHLSEIDVQKGDKVKLGQVVGREGQTGWATGPHLHFQINVWGIPVNPRVFLGPTGPER